MFDMCMVNPQMLMQAMQHDPRFAEVFGELTGIDLGALREQKRKDEEEEKKDAAKFEEE